MAAASRPGLVGFRISASDSTGLDWPRIDETWALAGELTVFSAGWMSDHVSDASRDRHGPAMESLTTVAALAHRVPGKWIGIAVAANTFRHPALLAKSATVIDNVTGGRFILGLGAGWHEGEHAAFGIPLPPIRERYDRYESAAAGADGAVLRRRAPGAGRLARRPVLPARRRDQRAGPGAPGRPCDLAGRPEDPGHRAGGALRGGLADARQPARRRRLLRRSSATRSPAPSRARAAIPRTSPSPRSCRAVSRRTRGARRSTRRARSSPRAPTT